MNLIETTPTTYVFEGGVTLPRVTSILSVVHKFDGINLDVLAHAAERGKAVHRGCWLLCGGGDASGLDWGTVHDEVAPYLHGFEAFLKATGARVVEKERLVLSTRYGFAGRADLLIEGLSRFLDVVDVKSGAEDPSHALQTSAYAEGYRESTGTKRKLGRFALYLRPTGTYRLQEMKEESDFRVFMACRQVYQWRMEHDRA